MALLVHVWLPRLALWVDLMLMIVMMCRVLNG